MRHLPVFLAAPLLCCSTVFADAAIRQFSPKIVYPYHYRSQDGTKADFGQLKRLVGDGVEIRVRDWYPNP